MGVKNHGPQTSHLGVKDVPISSCQWPSQYRPSTPHWLGVYLQGGKEAETRAGNGRRPRTRRTSRCRTKGGRTVVGPECLKGNDGHHFIDLNTTRLQESTSYFSSSIVWLQCQVDTQVVLGIFVTAPTMMVLLHHPPPSLLSFTQGPDETRQWTTSKGRDKGTRPTPSAGGPRVRPRW